MMQKRKYDFEYEEYDSIDDLKPDDAELLRAAMRATENSFADFSHFHVGAAGRVRGEKDIYIGSNQENASYPVGICAERSLLAAVASKFGTKKIIDTIAVSYDNRNKDKKSNIPLSPCGMCRQALIQYENNTDHQMRLILGGREGKIYVIGSASMLLPLAFNGEQLT